ncbi:MAG: hypothetical protein LBR70_06595 [Lactobacillaceae bacterium]|jgi:hypothetical protein|nr:hypothetical protein [Lactobacillaceae bacterium]
MNANNNEGSEPLFCQWKVHSAEKIQELTKHNGNFQKVKATLQTSDNPSGETVYGWIADYGTGHLFVPHDSDSALDAEKCWFEDIMPI